MSPPTQTLAETGRDDNVDWLSERDFYWEDFALFSTSSREDCRGERKAPYGTRVALCRQVRQRGRIAGDDLRSRLTAARRCGSATDRSLGVTLFRRTYASPSSFNARAICARASMVEYFS